MFKLVIAISLCHGILLTKVSAIVGEIECDQIPPSLYCKNEELARHCDVDHMCKRIEEKTFGKPVHMTLLYETLCPDSQRFFPKFMDFFEQFGQFVDVELVPFGNANFQEDGSLKCQHGEAECLANKFHACAVDIVERPLQFLNCSMLYMQYGIPWNDSVTMCSPYVTEAQMADIRDCYDNGKGDVLLKQHHARTASGWPEKHLGVPWMFFNNVSMRAAQFHMHDLSAAICDWYQGNVAAPRRCDKLS